MLKSMKLLLAVGDCNALGSGKMAGNSYPERVAQALGLQVVNKGHTMATTREGVRILQDNLTAANYVLIQFGLADSHTTFKYSPYVLYYPDNLLRKQLRSITKKYKKLCRRWGLNRVIGQVNVVPEQEYEARVREMVEAAVQGQVLLIDTIPHHEQDRNDRIKQYNAILDRICTEYDHCARVHLYQRFMENLDHWYMDNTLCNDAGYDYFTQKIINALKECTPQDVVDKTC
jgi:hypothetical protein